MSRIEILPPRKPGYPPRITGVAWWMLVGARLWSPPLIVALAAVAWFNVLRLQDTRWDFWWLNAVAAPMALLGGAMQLRMLINSLQHWTWHGERREHIAYLKKHGG